MSLLTPRGRGRSLLGAAAALLFLDGPAAAGAIADPGSLYMQTNDLAGDVVHRVSCLHTPSSPPQDRR
jgi:hypothetical protein